MAFADFITRTRSLTGLYLVTLPRAWYYWTFKHTQEKKYLRGQLKMELDSPSVLFFTLNKAGSNIAHWLIEPVLTKKGLVHIDWEGYWATNPEIRENRLFSNHPDGSLFKNTGFYYGPLRHYVHLRNTGEFKIIVMVRDPRDLLTSHYFSMTKSHPVLTKKYLDKRIKALKTTIDEHVLNYAHDFHKTFSDYINYLAGKPNVILLTYEEMVTDTLGWCRKLDEFLGTNGDFANSVPELQRKGVFASKKEESGEHVRKIQPGDHKEKLKPATIEQLNHIFADVLKKLSYTP
ncbi:MAG: sulfotransferase domain-containing protein [Flavobacteriales bacterium]